ncbi:unnamed protein product [Penicillium manginii]
MFSSSNFDDSHDLLNFEIYDRDTKSLTSPQMRIYRRPTLTSGSGQTRSVDEIRMIFILGSNLNGYSGILHGRIVTTVLDEYTGILVLCSKYKTSDDEALESGSKTVTAYLNTNFLGPVPTPGAIVVYAKLEETKENRK